MVIMWSAPAVDSMLAISLADIGARLCNVQKLIKFINTHIYWCCSQTGWIVVYNIHEKYSEHDIAMYNKNYILKPTR